MIAGAGLNNRATVEFVVESAPAAIARLARSACRSTRDGADGLAPDPRGRAQPPPHRPCRRRHRLGGAAGAGEGRRRPSQHHAHPRHGRDRPRHQPPWRALFGRRPCLGRLCARTARTGKVETFTAPRDDPRDRRRGPRLSVLDRAARRDRRRHRHGLAGGLPRLQHGVHAIPPDLPLQSGGQELPDHRGGARRGRAAQNPRDRPPLHARFRRAGRAGAARRRRPRDRP